MTVEKQKRKVGRPAKKRLICPLCKNQSVVLLKPGKLPQCYQPDDEDIGTEYYECRNRDGECPWATNILSDEPWHQFELQRLHEVNGFAKK